MTIRLSIFTVLLVLVHSALQSQVHDAEISYFKTNIVIRNRTKTEEIRYEIKINNRNGERFTKVSIPYSKLYKVSKIAAFIKDSEGETIKSLKKSEIVDKSIKNWFSFYEDNFIKEFTLKHSEYPYTLVYTYQYEAKEFLEICDWSPVIDNSIPTIQAELTITTPIDYKIRYKSESVNKPNIDTLNDIVNHKWNEKYDNLIRTETMSPPLQKLLPGVRVIPEIFSYETAGSLESWESFGNWQYNLMEGLNVLPDLEKMKILEITEKAKSQEEKILLLFHYLQDETRYINISLGTGGYKPHTAGYVVQNKYGDCKALSNYFKTMLDYIGIPSYYTKIYANRYIPDFATDFPSPQFNHIILNIPQKGGDLWLDCTNEAAFGYLGTSCQNREVLVVKKDSSFLAKTPALMPKDVLTTQKISVKMANNEAIVHFDGIYRGEWYEVLLSLESDYNESEKAFIVRNNFVPAGFQLNQYSIKKFERDSAKMGFSMETSTLNLYKIYGNELIIYNLTHNLPQFENPKKRKSAVQIDYPINFTDSIVFQIPAGYKVTGTSFSDSIVSEFGQYNLQVDLEAEAISLVKKILILPNFIPIASYKAFYDFYKEIFDREANLHFTFIKE